METFQLKKPWHALAVDMVVDHLGTDALGGLTESEADSRLKSLGPNELPTSKAPSMTVIFLHQFLSPLIYLLIVAGIVSLIVGDEKDALVILAVVVLNAVIGAFQEGRAEHSLEALRKLSKLKARVVRDGKEIEIEAGNVVPGDIISINAGDAIPADARILQAASLTVAEAALTGESVPIGKSANELKEDTVLADRQNMLYAGTYATAGRGTAVVVATGLKNEVGKISALATNTIKLKTQLERRIHDFGRKIAIVAVVLFFIMLGIGLLRGLEFTEIFMIAVSQMVSLVPEGLPVALTIALSVGVQRMARKGTIVRRLAAVESLGSTTVICSDKTGTLTRNEMTVKEFFSMPSRKRIQVTGIGYEPTGDLLSAGRKLGDDELSSFRDLFVALTVCNDAQLQQASDQEGRWLIIGDPTEAALLSLVAKAGLAIDTIRQSYPRIAEVPFDSDTKMMAVECRDGDDRFIIIKGAPESVFSLADSTSNVGNPSMATDSLQMAREVAKEMATAALRVLAVGRVRGVRLDSARGYSPLMGKLEIIGIIGELDPPRLEVADAVKDCRNAGIRPVMVTGDHKATGVAIARQLGIIRDGDLALDGNELEQLTDADLQQQIGRISVFARVHPAQKLRIVEALQTQGQIVAMTGDGVNDAPALVRADVGVAMGITGTEVAKEAAKVVITDDNFATIVAAISEGRLVYQNVKKLLLFLFVTSIDEVILLFLALILGYPPPLAAVQILWINLVSEGALTVNLIMEPAEGDEMRRQPTPVNEPLLDRSLLARMPLMVIASVISTFGWFLFRTHSGAAPNQVQTETFTVLVVCQWFNVINCRSATHSALNLELFKNPWLVGGLVVANVMHLLVIYWQPLADFFHTVPIDIQHFLTIGAVASLVLWVEEIRKFIRRRQLLGRHGSLTYS